MPVILATQEAELRRFKVRSQPGQIVLRDPHGIGPEFKPQCCERKKTKKAGQAQ
jgi:hypothetical protein